MYSTMAAPFLSPATVTRRNLLSSLQRSCNRPTCRSARLFADVKTRDEKESGELPARLVVKGIPKGDCDPSSDGELASNSLQDGPAFVQPPYPSCGAYWPLPSKTAALTPIADFYAGL